MYIFIPWWMYRVCLPYIIMHNIQTMIEEVRRERSRNGNRRDETNVVTILNGRSAALKCIRGINEGNARCFETIYTETTRKKYVQKEKEPYAFA